MLKDIHSGHEVKGGAWQSADFEVNVCRRQPAPVKTPLAEAEQGRANVCQGDLDPMAGEEDTTRSYPGAKVQVAPAPVLPGKVPSRDVSQRGSIIAQGVPPHQFVEGRLTRIVKSLYRLTIIRVNPRMPFIFQGGYGMLAVTLDLGHIRTAHVQAQFSE